MGNEDKKKILVIDDDIASMELLQQRLKAWGYEVMTASDGKIGWEMVENHEPHLVIMDILLPKMNGFQLCKRIKEEPRFSPIPIIMLTAVYIDEVDRNKGLQVGAQSYLMKADVYMSKPFIPDQLLDTIRVLLGEKRVEKVVIKEKILVIDDDPATLELLQIRLEAEGYEVAVVPDGESGLKRIESEKPSLVILDIQLPRMSGMEVLTEIKKERTPMSVVMITAYGSEDIAIESMRQGADDYLTKPIDHNELIASVKRNLEKNRLMLNTERLIRMLKNSNIRLMEQYNQLEQTKTTLEEKVDQLRQAKEELEAKLRQLQVSEEKFKQASTQLIQTERLTALGELAAGVAHELNQPLNAMKIILQDIVHSIKRDELKQDSLLVDINTLIQQIDKMAQIIGHMRTYARKIGEGEKRMVEVNEVIERVLRLIGEELKVHHIEVIKQLDPQLPGILAESTALEQVLMNLIINARDAVEERQPPEGMKIWISTQSQEDPSGKRALVIRIRDNGSGMTEEIRKKAFEPFFTTKEPGQGIGLGLSIARNTLHMYEGSVVIESTSAEGTTFKIEFPVRR